METPHGTTETKFSSRLFTVVSRRGRFYANCFRSYFVTLPVRFERLKHNGSLNSNDLFKLWSTHTCTTRRLPISWWGYQFICSFQLTNERSVSAQQSFPARMLSAGTLIPSKLAAPKRFSNVFAFIYESQHETPRAKL